MKKVLALLLIGIFLTSFALAYKITVKVVDTPEESNSNANKNIERIGQGRARVHGQDMDSELEFEGEEAIDSEGNKHKIKITPQEVKVLIRNRLRIRDDSDLSFELKEKIHNNIPRVIYNIEAKEHGKFLGIFKIAARSITEIDAETGEVLKVRRPWWAFLVRIPEISDEGENDEEESGCIGEGESAAVYPGNECCEGLTTIGCDGPGEDGKCEYGCIGALVCTNCGDGECGDSENKCNCPEDCGGDICGDGICGEREATSEQFSSCSSEDDTYCNYMLCVEDCQ